MFHVQLSSKALLAIVITFWQCHISSAQSHHSAVAAKFCDLGTWALSGACLNVFASSVNVSICLLLQYVSSQQFAES